MNLLFENWRKYLKEDTKVSVPVSFGLKKVEANKDKTWVFFDTETTGFGARNNAITEIGAIAVDPNNWEGDPEIISTFSQKAKLTPRVRERDPESDLGKVTKDVLAMTRYGEKSPEKGRFIPEKEMIDKFYDWLNGLGDVVLVIQNARFDMNMLSVRYNADPETGRASGAGAVGKELPRYPIIDTIPILKEYLIPFWKTKANEGDPDAETFLSHLISKKGKKASASQGPVASAFGIPIIGWHAAIDDVKMLMQIFQRVVETIRSGEDTDIRDEHEKVAKKLKRKQRRKRKKLSEQETSTKKVILMSGGPGSGKTHTIKSLGLDNYEIVNMDKFYEQGLGELGLGTNIRGIKNDYLDARDKLTKIIKNVLGLEEAEEKIKHLELMKLYDEALNQEPVNQELTSLKKEYDLRYSNIQKIGKLFAQSQKQAKGQQTGLLEQGKSFIIDGTGGNYAIIKKQKESMEKQGYKTAMIFVDVPEEIALARQVTRHEKEGGRQLPSGAVKRSLAAVNKNKDKYKELFGDNFFHVISTDEDFDASIAEIQPRVNAFLKQVNEDFQQDVKKQHKKMKIRLIGLGGNKKKEDPYVKNPSMKRSKSAPPGAGGS